MQPRTLDLADTSPVRGLRRHGLRPAGVVAQSVAAIAPTAALVHTPALLYAGGDGAALSMAAALAVTLLVAAGVTTFARRLAAPGSLYTYAVKGFGAAGGLLTAAALGLGYAFVSMSSLVGAAANLTRLAGRAAGVDLTGQRPLLASVVALLALGVGTLVAAGVRRTSIVLLVTESVAIGAIVVLLVVATVRGLPEAADPSALAAAWSPADGLGPMAAGMVVALTAFIGFESSTALSAETRRPLRTVPRALWWTVLGTGVLLVLGTTAQVVGYRVHGVDAGRSAYPVDDLLVAVGMGGARGVLELVAAVSFVACAIASTTALARLALALAVDGLLPERFARPHPRLRTPHRALLVVTPVLAAVPAAALGTLGVRAAMDLLIEVSVLGYLVAYLLVCAAAPVFLHRIGERTAASVAGGVLTTAVLVGAVVAHLVRPTPVRGWVGAATLLLIAASGLGWWAVTRWRPPDRAVQLGRYDEATVDDVWWGPAPALAGARRPGT